MLLQTKIFQYTLLWFQVDKLCNYVIEKTRCINEIKYLKKHNEVNQVNFLPNKEKVLGTKEKVASSILKERFVGKTNVIFKETPTPITKIRCNYNMPFCLTDLMFSSKILDGLMAEQISKQFAAFNLFRIL